MLSRLSGSLGRSFDVFTQLKPQRTSYIHSYACSKVLMGNLSVTTNLLAASRIRGPQALGNVRVYLSRHFTENVHDKWLNHWWGQSAYTTSPAIRTLALERQHDRDINQLLKFHDIKHVMQDSVSELAKHPNITIIREEDLKIKLVKPHPDGFEIIHTDNSSHIVPEDTHFYNAVRLARLQHGIEGVPEPDCHTDLYLHDISPTSLVLWGSGRSAIWVAQSFPNIPIYMIMLPSEYDHFQKKTLPAMFDGEAYPENITAISTDDLGRLGSDKRYAFLEDESGHHLMDQDKQIQLSDGKSYGAMGMALDTKTTQFVPESSKSDIHASSLLGSWHAHMMNPIGGASYISSVYNEMAAPHDQMLMLHGLSSQTVETPVHMFASQYNEQVGPGGRFVHAFPMHFQDCLLDAITDNVHHGDMHLNNRYPITPVRLKFAYLKAFRQSFYASYQKQPTQAELNRFTSIYRELEQKAFSQLNPDLEIKHYRH